MARVTVIEARDRIGGRTRTSNLWPGLPTDLGASWFHGTKDNTATALARKVGLTLTATSYKRLVTFDEAGQQVPCIKPAKRALKLVETARGRVDDLEADVSLMVAVLASPTWAALTLRDRRVARLAISTRIKHEYSGD